MTAGCSPETGGTLQGEITGKYGPASATVGFETDLDCFNTKGSAKVGVFGLRGRRRHQR